MIPLAKPTIGKEEKDLVLKTLDSGILSLGPNLENFSKLFAKYIGTKFAVPVNSGTSGLHLIVKSLGIGEGDEVITTPFSFVASSNCLLYENAKPIFVDVDKDSFNLDPNQIERKISRKTKAILVVHVFGQSCDMDKILKIARKHNLYVIEDAAESIGAKYKNKMVGTFGDASVFAFYPNKQITTGEGGIITTSRRDIFQLCSSFANQGRGEDMSWLRHERIGFNYRMDELSAALGVAQLKKLPKFLKERHLIAKKYLRALQGLEGVVLPKTKPHNTHSWFVFAIRVSNQQLRDGLIDYLNQNGVQSKAYFYPPIHLQPFYKKEFGFKKGDFAVTEKLSDTTLILPFFVGLTDNQILEVVEKLKSGLKLYEKRIQG